MIAFLSQRIPAWEWEAGGKGHSGDYCPLTIFFVQGELCLLMEKWILKHTSSLHIAHTSFISQPDQHPSVFYHVRVTYKSCEILSISCKIPHECEAP